MNMHDVRLIAGEGELEAKDVLAACNVRIRGLEAYANKADREHDDLCHRLLDADEKIATLAAEMDSREESAFRAGYKEEGIAVLEDRAWLAYKAARGEGDNADHSQ